MAAAPEAVPPPRRRRAPSVDDAEFREFVRTFNDWNQYEDVADRTPMLVIDAGRFNWKAGDAGRDSPCEIEPEAAEAVRLGRELQRLRNGGADWSQQAELQLLRDHRDTCCAKMVESLSQRVARGEVQPYELALVTVPLLERPDDPEGQATWLMRRLFDGLPSLRGIALQNQELLSLYASGRTTGLVVNLGSELSAVAIWEGYLLSHTANVVRNPQYDSLPSSAQNVEAMERWVHTSGLVDVVEGAIAEAPIDTRKDLLTNIVITGGMRAQLGTAGQACCEHLPSALLRRLTTVGYLRSNPPGVGAVAEHPVDRFIQLVCPPERDCAAWIGGSVVGSLNATFRSREPLIVSRERYEAFVALDTKFTAADTSYLLGAAERMLVPVGPDLRLAAARRALAWARCLLHFDASSSAELAGLPTDLVVQVGQLLVHPAAPRGAATPPEGDRTDAELALLTAPRLQGGEQGQMCEPQCWTKAGAERVARARYIGRSTVQPPTGGLSLLDRDRGPGRIRVMLDLS